MSSGLLRKISEKLELIEWVVIVVGLTKVQDSLEILEVAVSQLIDELLPVICILIIVIVVIAHEQANEELLLLKAFLDLIFSNRHEIAHFIFWRALEPVKSAT